MLDAENKHLVNVPFTLDSTNGSDLMALVEKYTLGKNFGMISLHSCGDLTPAMLYTFAKSNIEELKFICAFSCCYHLMESKTDGSVSNFPMSDSLKRVLNRTGFQLGLFGLRLACQQDM